ncbi:MAG: hypothetical protein IJR06_04405 [Paludibacteraceae bacterium]|nr:hypothetical protein [Paludibacteraceae bacterium]
MKDIKLLDGSVLHLPTEWGELTQEQTLRSMELLPLVVAGQMTPFDFQLEMLLMITRYKPAKRYWRSWWQTFSRLIMPEKHAAAMEMEEFRQECVRYNLIRMAEMLTFAFEVKDGVVTLNYYFADNPFAYMVPGAARFTRRLTIETNMTARQFADGVDLLSGVNGSDSEEFHLHILRRLSAVMYNLEYDDTEKLPMAVLFGTSLWFTGVVQYFKEHPVYGMLFRRSTTATAGSDSAFNLGMGEVILSLEKSGYHNAAAMNLLEFMDAQIKMIKDTVAKAAAEGVKTGEIASKTGLSVADVIRLQ